MQQGVSSVLPIARPGQYFCVLIQKPKEYYFVKVPADMMLAFQNGLKTRKIELQKYSAEIVASGKGEPDQATKDEITSRYGCDLQLSIPLK